MPPRTLIKNRAGDGPARHSVGVFGLIVADVIARPMDPRHPPAPGGMQVVDSITFTTGGNVCNTGLALSRLGLKVAAAGLVGDDVLGAAVIERLAAAGIDTAAVFETAAAQTSATVVAVEPGGERCFFHAVGATPLLDAAAFRRCLGIFKRCAAVHIGYFGLLPALTADLPVLLAELRRLAPRTLISLDTVNPPAPWRLLKPILPHLDVFAPSRTEARALSGRDDPPAMTAFFRRHMPRGLIGIKLDADGCYLDDARQAVTVPACRIRLVDTTGAGDTWFGALLAARLGNMSLLDCGRFANRAAADCCTALGASAGVRSFSDTLARM